jgi:hypothetical protein
MRICLYVDASRLLRWHIWLAEALSGDGKNEVVLCRSDVSRPWPPAFQLVLTLEKLIHRLKGEQACDFAPAPLPLLQRLADLDGNRRFDLVVNCVGRFDRLPAARRILTPLFNGQPSEFGALEALLDHGDVEIGVLSGTDPGQLIDCGTVAMEKRTVLTSSLNSVFSRAAELVIKAVNSPREDALGEYDPVDRSVAGKKVIVLTSVTLSFLAARVAEKLQRRLSRTVTTRAKWGLGSRLIQGKGLVGALAPNDATFNLLKDDNQRQYADPIIISDRGRHFVFCEEYQFTIEKGLVSVSEIDETGKLSQPRVVFEQPHHLSYPHVFRDEGEIWMIPEEGDNASISLYRAVEFPHAWVFECELLSGLRGFDATLHRNADGYWLFVTMRRWQSTDWDSLSLFRADTLRGPWAQVENNPVLLDARAARPAGPLFELGGQLYRPAQDCSTMYGGALTICRIDQLSRNAYRQTPVGHISGKAHGVHTYTRSGPFEIVDFFGDVDNVGTATAVYTDPAEGWSRQESLRRAGARRSPRFGMG